MFRSPEGKERPPGEIDLVTEKILMMLRDLDEGKKRDVPKYVQKEKLLMDLLDEMKGRGEAG